VTKKRTFSTPLCQEFWSPRDVIRKVAATFQGQKLTALTVRTKPAGGEFVFDLGGRLAYQVRDADEQTLWTFRTRLDPDPDDVDIVSFTAAGTVSLFTLRGTVHEPREYVQETKDYMLQDGALAPVYELTHACFVGSC
jgi:hypothetical protein